MIIYVVDAHSGTLRLKVEREPYIHPKLGKIYRIIEEDGFYVISNLSYRFWVPSENKWLWFSQSSIDLLAQPELGSA